MITYSEKGWQLNLIYPWYTVMSKNLAAFKLHGSFACTPIFFYLIVCISHTKPEMEIAWATSGIFFLCKNPEQTHLFHMSNICLNHNLNKMIKICICDDSVNGGDMDHPHYNNLCKHVSMSHHHWNNLDEHTPKLPHWATPRLNISIIHNKVCFIKWTYIQTNVKFTYCKSGILRKHLLQSRVSWETVERLICHRLVFRPANWSNNTDWKNKHTESFLTII